MRPAQSASVGRASVTPWRAAICASRYSGRWSANLETMTHANKPTAAMPPSMAAGVAAIPALATLLAFSLHMAVAHFPS